MADFSGYIAADELYDGPFCVLSIVDNHTFKRLIYEVLEQDPTHDDIRAFFRRFRKILEARGLTLAGIASDGSQLYPVPIADVFGRIPHQVCEFHVLAEITKAVLKAVAKVRKSLASTMPKLGRGRPSKATKRLARRRNRIQGKITDLFQHRHLFVQRGLTPASRPSAAAKLRVSDFGSSVLSAPKTEKVAGSRPTAMASTGPIRHGIRSPPSVRRRTRIPRLPVEAIADTLRAKRMGIA